MTTQQQSRSELLIRRDNTFSEKVSKKAEHRGGSPTTNPTAPSARNLRRHPIQAEQVHGRERCPVARTGYCVEQDSAGVIKQNVADGGFSVELDCDNGSGNKGNSSITTLVYIPSGSYELRYNYASRVSYPNYEPVYLCSSAASDLSWANDTNSQGGPVANALRTNQMNVYLDLNNSASNVPPTHTTIDGTQQLDGSNLIDLCVYSLDWVERSVSINVTTAGYYWLTFAADGTSDSYGAQLDNVRLCQVSCPGSLQDNFSTAWPTSTLLFNDNLESPTYSGSPYNSNGNLNNSYGASNYFTTAGNGWANAPTNQTVYWTTGCSQGVQCVELGGGSNGLMSKPLLLVPGYYQISYKYLSQVIFANLGSTVYCGATPGTANISGLSSTTNGVIPAASNYSTGAVKNDTNIVAMFMSHPQMASTPNRGNALGSTTSYTNPDGSTSTTPTTPPNAISLTSYTPSSVSPLLDIAAIRRRRRREA